MYSAIAALIKENPQLDELLRASGSTDKATAVLAAVEIAKALELPLRQGIMSGDILNGIFEAINFPAGTAIEWPLDFLSPGTEKEFVAYTIPNSGYIPHRAIQGDYVQVPTYDVGASIDWLTKYARDARWDIVGRAMEVMQAQFVKKMNDDGFTTLLAAAADRNILVFDSDAAVGQLTKRLISLAKVVMRRNGGGNSGSNGRGKLTDVFLSPEGMEDIRNWNVDQVDEITRHEIYSASDDSGKLTRIFGVNLHDLDELGDGQEYQNFLLTDLGASLGSDTEFALGLDLSNRDSFIMPVRENVSITVDDSMLRSRKMGLYGTAEVGFCALDSRRAILMSF